MRKNLFFAWLLPLLWASCSLAHSRFPGDEYAMYAISSIAGVWIQLVLRYDNPLFIVISTTITGAIVMAGFGYLMDRAHVRKGMWKILLAAFALTIFFLTTFSFPTLAEARYKHGSLLAYVFSAFNEGLYASVVLSFFFRESPKTECSADLPDDPHKVM